MVDRVRRIAAELWDRAAEIAEHVHALDYLLQDPVAQRDARARRDASLMIPKDGGALAAGGA